MVSRHRPPIQTTPFQFVIQDGPIYYIINHRPSITQRSLQIEPFLKESFQVFFTCWASPQDCHLRSSVLNHLWRPREWLEKYFW